MAILAVAVVGASCGGNKATSPSAVPAPSMGAGAPAATAGATIRGTVKTGVPARLNSRQSLAAVSGLTVSVVGTTLFAQVGPDGSFQLTGVWPGSVTLHFSGPGINADGIVPHVKDGEEVHVTVSLVGSVAQIAIVGSNEGRGNSEDDNEDNDDVEEDDDRHDGPGGQEVEVKGIVSGLTGTCPVLTFSVGTVLVTTGAATEFEEGSCADLANGDEVKVEGHRQADGSVVAREVEQEGNDDDDDDDDDDEEDEEEEEGDHHRAR